MAHDDAAGTLTERGLRVHIEAHAARVLVGARGAAGAENGLRLPVLEAVEAVNNDQKNLLAAKVLAEFGPDLRGRRFAVWGLAFKPNTDDMRAAPSRNLVTALLRAGAQVVAHDPVAAHEALHALRSDLADQPALLAQFSLADKPLDALEAADALIIVTEWKAYRSPNLVAMKRQLRQPLIIDGRNLYEPDAMQAAGFRYLAVGRPIP